MVCSSNVVSLLWLLVTGCGSPLFLVGLVQGQTEAAETSKYVADVFLSTVCSLPDLGWLLPDGTVVTTQDVDEIIILSAVPKIVTAPRKYAIAAKDSLQFNKAHHVACEVPAGGVPIRLFIFSASLSPQGHNPQVFSIEHPFPDSLRDIKSSSHRSRRC